MAIQPRLRLPNPSRAFTARRRPAGVPKLARGGCARPATPDQAVGWNLPAGESVKTSQPSEVTPTECSN